MGVLRSGPKGRGRASAPSLTNAAGSHSYRETQGSEDSLDTSPATVCITFVQSRHTKIQYHSEAGEGSGDEEDEFGDFKSAVSSTVGSIKAKGIKDAEAIKMKVQKGFKVID